MKSKTFRKTILKILTIVVVIVIVGFYRNPNTKNMKVYKTEHFSIYHNQLKDATLVSLEDELENQYSKVKEFFDLPMEKTSEIIIFDDVETFQRKSYGLIISWLLPDWAVGAALGNKVIMVSPENADSSHNYEDMIEIASHEWIHTNIYAISKMVDIWLDEGAAIYFSNQKQPLIGEIPSYDDLNKTSINGFVDAEGYCYGYYWFEYIYNNYSKEQIHSLIQSNDYIGSLGMSKEALYSSWVTYMTP